MGHLRPHGDISSPEIPAPEETFWLQKQSERATPPLPTTAATKKAQIVPFTPPPASPQSSGDTEKPKGFSKSVPSPFPRSRELPFAVFSRLSLHYLQSSRSSPGAGNIIRLRRGAEPERRSATSRGAQHSPDRCRRLAASPRPPARPFVQPSAPTRRGAGMNPSLVSADDFTSLACS